MNLKPKTPPPPPPGGAAPNGDKPKLEVSANGPGIALKGGSAPPVGNAIRSPVALGGAAAVGQKPAVSKKAAAAVAEKAKAEADKPEVSNIANRDIFSRHEPTAATRVSHFMADRSRGRPKKILFMFVVMALIAGAGVMIAMPDIREQVMTDVTNSYDDLIGAVRYRKKAPAAPSQNVKQETRAAYIPKQSTAGTSDCRALVHKSTGNSSMTVPQRLQVAECFLLIDDPVGAEAALKPTMNKLSRATEAELNAMPANLTLADAHQMMVGVMIRQGRLREAGELLRGRCQKWAQSNTCVAKLMLIAERKIGSTDGDALNVMFGSRGRLDGKAQARLWLAGAAIATSQAKPKVADQRYVMALSAAPRKAMALRKQIYESQAVDLYHRGELLKIKAAISRAMMDLKSLSSNSKIKLQLLSDLATVSDRGKVVRQALSREEVTFRTRGDFDIIEILGPESIRRNQQEAFLRLLKRTRDHYTTKYKAADSFVTRLDAWEIRAHASAGHGEQALTKLNGYDKEHGADLTSHHLRGVVYMSMSEHAKYRLLAAAAFQEALKLNSNWESLYGLGAALTRGGKPVQVSAIIRDLDAKVATPGQRYWADMLKAEWYIAKAKYPNAQKILAEWSEAEPTFYGPQQLLLQLSQKLGRKADVEKAEAALDNLRRSQPYDGSREASASPLGFLALARRPID